MVGHQHSLSWTVDSRHLSSGDLARMAGILPLSAGQEIRYATTEFVVTFYSRLLGLMSAAQGIGSLAVSCRSELNLILPHVGSVGYSIIPLPV